MTIKRWLGWSILLTGGLTAVLPFAVGYLLDDLRVAPLYWLRSESASEFEKTIQLGQAGNDRFSVKFSFEHGNSSSFAEVELFNGTSRVARLGGNESTFLGFRDVDKDGAKELLFTSTSTYATGRAVWKYSGGRWTEIPQTQSARRILEMAEILFYGPLFLVLGLLCFLLGLLFLVERKRSLNQDIDVKTTKT